MTQLTFTKNETTNNYECVFTVNNDFNIHVERDIKNLSRITVAVTTVQNSQYQVVYDELEGNVFDHDFDAIVYPKYIKVTSDVQPSNAYVTEMN